MSHLATMDGSTVGFEIQRLKAIKGMTARQAADYLDQHGPESALISCAIDRPDLVGFSVVDLSNGNGAAAA